jgi:hypothetical protein
MVHYGFPIILNMRRNAHETLIATYGLRGKWLSFKVSFTYCEIQKHKRQKPQQ